MRLYEDECDPWLKLRDSGKCIKNSRSSQNRALKGCHIRIRIIQWANQAAKIRMCLCIFLTCIILEVGHHVLCCGGLKWACCTSS
jgi:hypothetical protein